MRHRRQPVVNVVLVVAGLWSVTTTLCAAPRRDTISVSCEVPGATVFVDGRDEGLAPVSLELTTREAHHIVLVHSDYLPVERIVEPVVRWSLLAPAAANGLGLGVASAAFDLLLGRAQALEPSEVHVASALLVRRGNGDGTLEVGVDPVSGLGTGERGL